MAYQYTQNLALPRMRERHGIVSSDPVLVIGGKTLATCNIWFYVNRASSNETEAEPVDYHRVMTLDTLRRDADYLLHEAAYQTGAIELTAENGRERISAPFFFT